MNVSADACLSRSSPSLAKPSKFSQSLPPLLPGRKTAKQQNTACSNVWHIQVIPQQPGERAGTRLQHKLRLRRIKRRSPALASFHLFSCTFSWKIVMAPLCDWQQTGWETRGPCCAALTPRLLLTLENNYVKMILTQKQQKTSLRSKHK